MTDFVLLNWKEHLAELPALKTRLTLDELHELSLRRHADRSLISRSLLKGFLSERLRRDTIALATTDNGKLFLPDSEMHFSVAHSGDWMAFAFHPEKKIGIDIETWERAEQVLRFAPRYFKPRENAFIDKDPALRFERALQIWTCKEAWLKAVGTTLFAALEHQEIPITLGGQIDIQVGVRFDHQVQPGSYYLTVATTSD